MNRIIQGNILDITEGVICHQVNCQRLAGAGLALQIRNKYPDWYKAFKEREPLLGSVGIFPSHPNLWIVDLYAQWSVGIGGRQTDYVAFRECLSKVKNVGENLHWLDYLPQDLIYLPYGIGCGLAGGDWNIVSKIIEEELPTAVLVQLGD